MRKIFIICLFVVFNIWIFAQNSVLNFNTRGVYVKEEVATPTQNVSNNQNYIDVEYNFEEAIVSDIRRDNNTFQLVKIKGFGLMDEIGKPALPAYNDILAVPSKNGLSVQIIEAQYADFENFYIHPALEPEIALIGDITKQRFILDETTYYTDFYFPENIVEIVSTQDYRGVPLAFVQIRPVQYNPVIKKLRCYSKIKYRIVFESQGVASNIINYKQKSYDVLKNILSNPDILMESTNQNTAVQQNRAGSKNYIIVTTDRFLPAVQEFAAWKIRMGYSCEIVSQTSWTDVQVKSAVHTRYNSWNPKPEYLLIVGDHEDVPGEVYSNAYSSYEDYATDLYYVCMGGSTDYTADMARGRVSVNSLEQAYLVLRKIINYEINPIIDVAFYKTGLNSAQFEDGNDIYDGYEDTRLTCTSEEVRDYLISKGKIISRVYSAYSNVYPKYYNKSWYANGQPIPAELRKDIPPYYTWNDNGINIINEINAGQFYVLYLGHGNYSGWGSLHPGFFVEDIPNLININKLPVVFSMACLTGGYLQQECFAEKIIRYPSGGSIGVFAASQVAYSGLIDALTVGMFDAIWSNPGLIAQFGSGGTSNPIFFNSHSDIYKMGYVLNQGLLRMEQTWTSTSNNMQRYHNEIFHYFGDPSMEMYTASPTNFTNVTVSINGTNVTVNTGRVSGCKIAVTSNDYGETYFEVADNVSSYTFPNVIVPCYITITKHNYIPYIMESVCATSNLINQTIITTQTVTNCDINAQNVIVNGATLTLEAGRNINIQNITVKNNGKLILDAGGDVNIISDFDVELGSELEIR